MGDRRQLGTGALSVLPDNVLGHLFTYFTYPELILFSSVSPTFYVFCNDEGLWQDIFMKTTRSTFHFDGSWKHATLLRGKKTSKELTLPRTLHFEGIYSVWLYTRWYRAHVDVADFGSDKGEIERKKYSEFAVDDFLNNFDAMSRPVMICGATDHWTAHTNWNRENLAKKWGETEFKVSERGSRKFKMKMKDYLRYLEVAHDEDPLYIFDSGFGERAPDMLSDYDVPKYFPDDFLNFMGKYKPSYRWFVMGPPRSGAPWHVDPAGTSAWNALLHGRKRWLLYPPGGMPPGVIPQVTPKGEHIFISPSSIMWLLEVYPFLEEKDKPMECIQNPGELIYVPGGWWHMVLNMTESVAVTQNFANEHNFLNVCDDFYDSKRETYYYFKHKMLEAKPEYAPKFQEFEDSVDGIFVDFDDLEFWSPYIQQLLKSHNLPTPAGEDIQVLADGTNPVFLTNNMVIKFYSKHYGGLRSYLAETGMYVSAQSSPIAEICPKLLAQGKIQITQTIKPEPKHKNNIMVDHDEQATFKDGSKSNQEGKKEEEKEAEEKMEAEEKEKKEAEKKEKKEEKEITLSSEWPYVVMTFIEGSNIVTAREEERDIDMSEVALFLARNLAVLHGLKVTEQPEDPYADYLKFLQDRRTKAVRGHWLWGTLPQDLIKQIEEYLPASSLSSDMIFADHVVPIHGDITDENVIGVDTKTKTKAKPQRPRKKHGKIAKTKEAKSKAWTPKYMIDFGDSRFADISYELVSLFMSVFECKKDLLEIFYKNYTLPNKKDTLWDYYTQNKEKMVKKLMCATLLHECDALRTGFTHVPSARDAKSLDELAHTLFEL